MVGDYISTSIIKKQAVSVFAVGKPPRGSTKRQDMYSAGPLTISGGSRPARASGAHAVASAHSSATLPRQQ